jgi:Xaa-Pro aminopeptidase
MPGPTASDSRLAKLRAILPESDAEALIVSQPDNRAYLSGFLGSAGVLLISADRSLIATDFRYYEQARQECPHFELFPIRTNLVDVLPDFLAGCKGGRVGFEADHASFATVQSWMDAAPNVEWTPTKGIVAGLRAIKDDDELATLREAVLLADNALAAGLAMARPGMTENELAWGIESYMRTQGSQGVAFDLTVASGPNGSRPHARATQAALEAGQPIIIDMGAKVRGYRSDLTRTIVIGQPKEADRFWEVYNTVLRAQVAAEAAIRPGMTAPEVDALARNVIAAAGYGDYFGHGLGHGVGLEIHEQPLLSRISPAVVRPGMVITIEPGIYLPGWGGVRIEDIVLVTEDGAEVLTRAPKNPII